jgi:hypothetical protein
MFTTYGRNQLPYTYNDSKPFRISSTDTDSPDVNAKNAKNPGGEKIFKSTSFNTRKGNCLEGDAIIKQGTLGMAANTDKLGLRADTVSRATARLAHERHFRTRQQLLALLYKIKMWLMAMMTNENIKPDPNVLKRG